ncbi:MAG: DegT/DnrJ/EryC1/StrS family aminotransferase [Candidatus Omnitrophota bacterium]|nr:DegT/DnrJ/EryC1/StrS family aminotransferase [Candidatus Omnitrophota bacterium]
MKVPLTKIWTGAEEQQGVADVLGSSWLTQGEKVRKFEQLVAGYTGAANGVACSSGTAALQIALRLADVGAGDEVVIPSFTWIATANAVALAGAKPVFADIDLSTFNITPENIRPCLSAKTKAVIVVHQFGLPADLNSIQRLATENGLVLIEDAACALGSKYDGQYIGNSERLACLSFHPRKLVTTGEGGMLLTNSEEAAERARRLVNHGASVSDVVKHKTNRVQALLGESFPEVGYNFRLTDLQAAVGIAQMKRLDAILDSRARRAERYRQKLAHCDFLMLPATPAGRTHNWQSYVVRLRSRNAEARNAIAQYLLEQDIACRPAYMACHLQPAYREIYPSLSLPATEKALDTVLILPLYPQMSNEEQDYVIDNLITAIAAEYAYGTT